MHEFNLTQNLLDTALKRAGSKRIVRIKLLIGPFCEEREEPIALNWRDGVKGSCAEGAELHSVHWPLEIKCLDCSGTFYLDEESSMCKYCSSQRVQLVSRDKVRLESIEVK